MGQTTTNMPHALGGKTMTQTGSHPNFLYFKKYRTKVLFVLCVFFFLYIFMYMISFLIHFFCLALTLAMGLNGLHVLFCVWFVRLCCIVAGLVCFFPGQILRGKYFSEVYLLTLFINNIDGLAHVCYLFDFGSLCRFIVLLLPSLVVYLFTAWVLLQLLILEKFLPTVVVLSSPAAL